MYAGLAVMPAPKYPLESIRRLRKHKVDEAARELASAARARDSAERRRHLAEGRRNEHDATAAGVRASELEALMRGDRCVADLAQAESWEVAIGVEQQRLTAEARQAQVDEGRAAEGLLRAHARVASNQADAELIARDRFRWTEGETQAREARDEEASLEAWRPKS
jgi:flagellar biosynthesis chaperone FliJ